MPELRTAKITAAGLVRPNNEDSIGEFTFSFRERTVTCLVVADGVGGHKAGEIASKMTVDRLQTYLSENPDGVSALADYLVRTVERINRDVHREATARPECSGMGTTLTLALIDGGTLLIGHVGDSRAYRFRGGRLECLTDDHSVVGELVRQGQLTREEARLHPWHNIIEQAIGLDPQVEVSLYRSRVMEGDLLLLCTDGLSDLLSEDELQAVIEEYRFPQPILTELEQLALSRGAHDNYSIMLAYHEESDQND